MLSEVLSPPRTTSPILLERMAAAVVIAVGAAAELFAWAP
eukprot:SAG31_NODE_47257_length_251_cov_0.677632_1_plen_39_part_10